MKLREQLNKIQTDIALIQQDLAEHMRRTDLLEKRVAPLTKIYHFIQVAGALTVVTASIAAIAKAFL